MRALAGVCISNLLKTRGGFQHIIKKNKCKLEGANNDLRRSEASPVRFGREKRKEVMAYEANASYNRGLRTWMGTVILEAKIRWQPS